jgi:hypothetical protein
VFEVEPREVQVIAPRDGLSFGFQDTSALGCEAIHERAGTQPVKVVELGLGPVEVTVVEK